MAETFGFKGSEAIGLISGLGIIDNPIELIGLLLHALELYKENKEKFKEARERVEKKIEGLKKMGKTDRKSKFQLIYTRTPTAGAPITSFGLAETTLREGETFSYITTDETFSHGDKRVKNATLFTDDRYMVTGVSEDRHSVVAASMRTGRIDVFVATDALHPRTDKAVQVHILLEELNLNPLPPAKPHRSLPPRVA